MQSILDAINEWIKEILIGAINGNLSTMFGDVNEKVGTIAAEVGQTPQGWNANIFSMIQTLSENVIVPIAGLVITYVLCYELISMVTEKNNMHDVDTSMFFKWVFKAFVAVYLVTHTFDITMAVFDMAQHVVSGAAGVIGGSTSSGKRGEERVYTPKQAGEDFKLSVTYDTTVRYDGTQYVIYAGVYEIKKGEFPEGINLFSPDAKAFFTNPVNFWFDNTASSSVDLGWTDADGNLRKAGGAGARAARGAAGLPRSGVCSRKFCLCSNRYN